MEGVEPLKTVSSQEGIRTSIRVRQTVGLVVALTPMTVLALWLSGERTAVWVVLAVGLTSVLLGVGLNTWATSPLTRLSLRARLLAGVQLTPRPESRLLGGHPPGDVAISNALDDIESSMIEIQALNRISQLVVSDLDVEDTMRAVVEEAVKLLGADAGIIGLWEADREVFRDLVACNLPIAFPDREFGVQESFTSQVAEGGHVIFLDDYSSYPRRIRELDRFGFRATVGAPLTVRGESKGALTVLSSHQTRRFTVRDGELLATFANQAAAALEQARLKEVTSAQIRKYALSQGQLAQRTEELERALATIVRVQESEQSRIAADVHDEVVQSMVGSLYELQAVMAQYPHQQEAAVAKQDRAKNLMQKAIADLRRVIYDLRPYVLHEAGIVQAIERLADDFNSIAGFRPIVSTAGSPCRFQSEAEMAAYRIVQESFNNILRHSEATDAKVSLRFEADRITVSVSDNGKGFVVAPPGVKAEEKRFGLLGMRERARSVGGELNLTSAFDQGTAIVVTIPMHRRSLPVRADGRETDTAADEAGSLVSADDGNL
jgi:signal transduction histidine kinase